MIDFNTKDKLSSEVSGKQGVSAKQYTGSADILER